MKKCLDDMIADANIIKEAQKKNSTTSTNNDSGPILNLDYPQSIKTDREDR